MGLARPAHGPEPVHNVGYFRYLECSHLAEDGQPKGDITLWDEILFPFDPALADNRTLSGIPVEKSWAASNQEIEELYSCDSTGSVTVAIQNTVSHYGREFKLGRWSGKAAVVRPSAKKRSRKAST